MMMMHWNIAMMIGTEQERCFDYIVYKFGQLWSVNCRVNEAHLHTASVDLQRR